MSHVPSAVPVNLYDLIPYLEKTHGGQGRFLSASVYSRKVDFSTQPQSSAGEYLHWRNWGISNIKRFLRSAPQQDRLRLSRGSSNALILTFPPFLTYKLFLPHDEDGPDSKIKI